MAYVWYNSGMRRFLEWIGLKEQLHMQDHEPPLVSEREIWWASIGENVGSEIKFLAIAGEAAGKSRM